MAKNELEEILEENDETPYNRGDSREQNRYWLVESLETDSNFLALMQRLHRWSGIKGPMWDEDQILILGNKEARKTFRLKTSLISTNAITRPEYKLRDLSEEGDNIEVKYSRGKDEFVKRYVFHTETETIPEKKEIKYTLKEKTT